MCTFLIINDSQDEELAFYILLIFLVKIIMYSNDNNIEAFTSKEKSYSYILLLQKYSLFCWHVENKSIITQGVLQWSLYMRVLSLLEYKEFIIYFPLSSSVFIMNTFNEK